MSFTVYELVYLMTSVLATYSIYRILSAFMGELIVSKIVCFVSFAAYYLIVAGSVLLLKIPIVNLLLNIVLYFALTFCFEGSWGKRMTAVLFTYITAFCVDIISATVSGLIFPVSERIEYGSVFDCVLNSLLLFICTIVLIRLKSTDADINIPISFWCVIVAIPIATIIVLLIALINASTSRNEILICIALLYMINFFVFYLYEKISEFVEKRQKEQIIVQQNAYYAKQLALMETTLKATQSIRHDIKNHMASIYGSMVNGEMENAMEHISAMMDVYKYKNAFLTGNAAIDSVLNFKMEEAVHRGITLNAYTEIPEGVRIDPFDASVIIGNLLDNAFEAVSELDGNKTVECAVKYRVSVLIIEVKNPYSGERQKDGERYITTKKDKKNHGIGLKNVKDALRKYDGMLELNDDGNFFEAVAYLQIVMKPKNNEGEEGHGIDVV